MRLDKYLKVSRIIKRRTVANDACDAKHVTVNGKVARASYDVKVGDITIIAEIENTLPLALEAEVELFDANGEAVDIDVTFVEGYDRINGSEDGVTATNSTLRLNIGAGKSIDTKKLSKIDGIAFTLVAKSDANGSVAINAKQGVGARLSLELDGGITVDVKDFMTSNN